MNINLFASPIDDDVFVDTIIDATNGFIGGDFLARYDANYWETPVDIEAGPDAPNGMGSPYVSNIGNGEIRYGANALVEQPWAGRLIRLRLRKRVGAVGPAMFEIIRQDSGLVWETGVQDKDAEYYPLNSLSSITVL